MDLLFQAALTVAAYLLGVAFAGSFIGRKWMGTFDIFLHKLFRRKVTVAQYLYWKYFAGIENPPKPKKMEEANWLEKLALRYLLKIG